MRIARAPCERVNAIELQCAEWRREPKETAWLKANQKAIESPRNQKKEKVKTIAAAPSQKRATAGWQPTFGSGKKK